MRSARLGLLAAPLVLGCTNPQDAANTTDNDSEGGFTTAGSTGGMSTTATTPPASATEMSTSSTTMPDDTSSGSSGGVTSTGSGESTADASTSSGSTTEPGSTSSGEESGSSTGNSLRPFDFEDFDDPAALDDWYIRDVEEGTPAQYTVLDFDTTNPGKMTLVPTTSGWFGDYDGPFVYKLVSGDFMMETYVTCSGLADPDGPPTQTYNSAGIMLRDPANVPMGEDWVVHNTGFQELEVASEGKITINSSSTLTTVPGAHFGRLRICRFGGDIAVARKLDGDDEWTDTVEPYNDLLPMEVQAGMAVTAWNSTGNDPDFDEDPDMIATWSWVGFYEIDSMAQCYED